MIDPDPQARRDAELKAQLSKVKWPIDYGVVKVQIRGGQAHLVNHREND